MTSAVRYTRAMLAVLMCVSASAAFAARAEAQEPTYRFDGSVVMVKDSRGFVGVLFRLNRALPRRADGASAGLASLNGTINQRSLNRVSGRCYASILNYAPRWGRIGSFYPFKLRLTNGQTLKRNARLMKATTNYRINESNGLWRDPKVKRRLSC